MKTIYYKKQGRKYVPVSEYDSELMDAFTEGAHLVMCYPGGKSTRYNIDPNYAAMIAAGRLAEDTISKAIMKASDIRRTKRGENPEPLTPEQKAAWEHLVEVFGDSAKCLEWPSAREVAEKAVEVMQVEADKLMQHEGVKQAYEHFQLMCQLCKEGENNDQNR